MHEHKGAFMSISSHPILLAALDLDGTLLNSSGEVTDYTRKVLSEASDRGWSHAGRRWRTGCRRSPEGHFRGPRPPHRWR